MQDDQLYENVLPLAKAINEQKQTLVLQNERNAAIALRDLQSGVKVSLHYYSTSRSKIDRDCPAIILIFSDSCWFPYDQCSLHTKQIACLILETYHQLSSGIILDDNPATAKEGETYSIYDWLGR